MTADDFSPSHTLVANVEDGTIYFSDGTTMTGANHFSVSYNAIIKFADTGLHQSLNGSTFYRGTPLIYAVLYEWSGTKYQTFKKQNPLKVDETAKKLGTGKIKITHNLGKYNFAVAQAIDSTYWLFAQVAQLDKNSVTIWRIDRDGTLHDGNFFLFIYDMSEY